MGLGNYLGEAWTTVNGAWTTMDGMMDYYEWDGMMGLYSDHSLD